VRVVEVLSSRVLLYPGDFDRSVRFYTETLGLRVYREYGIGGRVTGLVLFLGGGFLELASGRRPPQQQGILLWLQVADLEAEHQRLAAAGVEIVEPPAEMPWGLVEMEVHDPDGTRLRLVEVPFGHPIRTRLT
jgi:predicted enzyme related to lactoylglutathione lyase